MSVEHGRDLLHPLREVEEHYVRQVPVHGAEMRLLTRFDAKASKLPRTFGLSWNNTKRPLLVLVACAMILAISVHDEMRRVSRIRFRPVFHNLPATSTNPLRPRPPIPQQQRPRFHDSMTPMNPSTPERSNTIEPSVRNSDMPSPQINESDSSWPLQEPRAYVPEFRRWSSSEKPRRTELLETPSSDWFWPGARATKAENSLPVGGGSSRSTTSPNNDEATPKPHQATVCQSPDVLKSAAYLDCSDQGLTLSEIVLLEPCGEDLYRSEKHECTEVENEPDGCTTDTLGDGKTCVDPISLKTAAFETCNAAGQQLADVVFDFGDCGGMATFVKYTCCTPDLPPNPPACHESVPKNAPSVCRDIGLMKQEAWELCSAEGNNLVDYKTWGDCPPGQASELVAICCEP
jgi:hypothetical protein